MPPRSAKKPAAPKKPSPKPAAKPDPAPAPAPAAEEVPAAPAPEVTAALAPVSAAEEVTVEETVVTTEVVEEKVVEEEVTAEEAAPEEEVEPEEEEVDPEEEEVEPMEEEEEEEPAEDGADLDKGMKEGEQKAGAVVVGAGDNQPTGGDSNQSGSGDESNQDDEKEDLSTLLQPHLTDKKENKEIEIFVGHLDKEAVEDDLIKIFGVFGELQSVRIVRSPDTQKSKGFGFVRFVNTEHAKKALAELKDGVQVKGKEIRISTSNDNDTLYLGNISKLWSKDKVMNELKELGVDQIKDIVLPADPKTEGKIKGFALIEFGSHAEAVTAFQRLRKPDAVFGCERSAKVAFSTSLHPSEESMSKVKSVYVEGLPESWDEDRVKEHCNQYGEIEKVRLVKSKKKIFGFVDFTSHESAVACVHGLLNTQLGEGDIKVQASLAKPKNKGRRQTNQEPRGGYLVKDGETEESLQAKQKEKRRARMPGAKAIVALKQVNQASKKESKPQPSKSQGETTPGKRRDRRGLNTVTNERPLKKPRSTDYGNRHGRPANSFGNQRAIYMPHPTAYAPSYAPPAPSYQPYAYARPSGSDRRHSDMEPHGGYLPAGRGAHYVSQTSSGFGYTRAAAVQPPHQGYPGYPGYEDPYGHPSSGAYGYPSSGAYAPRRGYY